MNTVFSFSVKKGIIQKLSIGQKVPFLR